MRKMTFVLSAALGLAGLPGSVETAASAPKLCPQFLAKYCVYNKQHLIFTAATNPCFASQRGWTVIYIGACKFGKA